MRKLLGVILLFLVSSVTHADIAVEAEDGHVFWASECANNYKFSYFDSHRIQRACIESTSSVPVEKFIALSRDHDCIGQVRVDSGVIRNGHLYADAVAQVWGCTGGQSSEFF